MFSAEEVIRRIEDPAVARDCCRQWISDIRFQMARCQDPMDLADYRDLLRKARNLLREL